MTDIATSRTLSIHTSLVVLSLARLLLQLQMLLITSTTIVCFLFSEGCVYDGLIWEFGSREVGWGGVGCYEASKCDNLKEKLLSLAANQSKWQSIPFWFSVKQWAHPNGTSEYSSRGSRCSGRHRDEYYYRGCGWFVVDCQKAWLTDSVLPCRSRMMACWLGLWRITRPHDVRGNHRGRLSWSLLQLYDTSRSVCSRKHEHTKAT